MTERQKKLIDAEVSRHLAVAKISEEPMRADHLEVANVLMVVLDAGRENDEKHFNRS